MNFINNKSKFLRKSIIKSSSAPNINNRNRYYQIKPVRNYEKYLKPTQNGISATGIFNEFIKKDLIKPNEKKSIYEKVNYTDRNHWSLHTSKNCTNVKYLPIFQQFKKYYFPKIENEKISKTYLKSDIISIKVPEIKKRENNNSFFEEKNKFGVQSESNSEWKDKANRISSINKSYVDYNIITNEKNPFFQKSKFLDKSVYNFQKGFGNYADEISTAAINFNPQHSNALKNNPNIFKKYNGIFSHIYDVSHRNGYIYYPFELKSMKIKKND